jgi:hypothetical protein
MPRIAANMDDLDAMVQLPDSHRGATLDLSRWRGTMCCCDDGGGGDCNDCAITFAVFRVRHDGIPNGAFTQEFLFENCPWLGVVVTRIEMILESDVVGIYDCPFTPGIMVDAISMMHAILEASKETDQNDYIPTICRLACMLHGSCSHNPRVLFTLDQEQERRKKALALKRQSGKQQELDDMLEMSKRATAESLAEDKRQEMAMWYIHGERPRYWANHS